MPENTTIYDSIFGQSPAVQAAAAARDASFQDWLNQRKQAVEQQRTEDRRIATFNALGNALTTMVQPLGWAIGGSTAGVQPVDNRQYLEAFNRALKSNEDLRNIGTLEGEYQFKLADEAYRRAQAVEDYQRKADIEFDKQKQIFDMRSQLSRQQMEERIKVAEATAKAKYIFSTRGGGRASESVIDNFLKRANSAYMGIVEDYEKKKNLGIVGLQEPEPYDKFIQKYGAGEGIIVSEGNPSGNGNAGSDNSKTPPSKRNK